MRLLIDYRPALRGRTGVGEYAHQLIRALLATRASAHSAGQLDITIFSSSWKDRLQLPAEIEGAQAIDRRVPVSVLNFAWHRLGWPPAEVLAGASFDVTHSLHPLLLPARTAAQVVTIHDLNFLRHPERTRAEIRRDYPSLVRAHAHRADHIIVPSRFTASEVAGQLQVPEHRISICSPGAPDWTPRAQPPADGYILFLGTLEPRKNLGALLDAYERLLSQRNERVPELVLAGQETAESGPWLDRIRRPPLAGHVRHLGYIDPSGRRSVYEGARLLVQPSFEEGFGIPVLEAMTLGVPVVATNRGALPEVLGQAGALVDPDNTEELAAAIVRVIDDPAYAGSCSARGVTQAQQFQWSTAAERAMAAYEQALARRRERRRSA